MILIVTTISVYLAVYKGVAMHEDDEDDDEPEEQRKRFGRKHKKPAPLPDEVMPVLPGESANPSAL